MYTFFKTFTFIDADVKTQEEAMTTATISNDVKVLSYEERDM